MKLTPFGKCIRKLRIDKGVTMRDMSIEFGKSSAYLSAMELGKKAVTYKHLENCIEYMGELNRKDILESYYYTCEYIKIRSDDLNMGVKKKLIEIIMEHGECND